MWMKRLVKVLDWVVGVLAAVALLMLFEQALGEPEAHHPRVFAGIDLVMLVALLLDIGARLWSADDRWAHVRRSYIDVFVLIPLIQLLGAGQHTARIYIVVRQAVLLWMEALHRGWLQRMIAALRLRPAQLLPCSFAAAILLGTILLMQPAATAQEGPLPLVDALFTATSATCVTGLIVRDTGRDFSTFGQVVILVLVQVGGLGIMTFSVWVVVQIGRGLQVREEVVMREMLDQETVADIVAQVGFIFRMTFLLEAVGAALLFVQWYGEPEFHSAANALYASVFHSISAFCNAGFSLFSDSFIKYRARVGINLVICGLVIVGGLGFAVVADLWEKSKHMGQRRRKVRPLRLHTKMALWVTGILLVLGTIGFFLAERRTTLAGLPLGEGVLASFFQAMTARTAGFNTVDFGLAGTAGTLLIVILMFIGASPGSTGGGIKTTTFWVLVQYAVSGLRDRGSVEVARRTVPAEVIRRAASILAISAAVLLCGLFALMLSEPARPFDDLLFEAGSALGTVGLSRLSTADTGALAATTKAVIIALMFIGRLGPLTIALALARPTSPARYAYAEERVMVG